MDKTLRTIKKFIPVKVFDFFAPAYHTLLAWTGALAYGFPSRSLKVIGITGTKGKSTTVFLAAKILEAAYPVKVAALGSLGYKIKDKEWPNTLKMTMPGRFKIQKFLAQAKRAGCEYVVMEVTSEGIAQKRHLGITFDCAVFTNLHPEHLERHGSFEAYRAAKQELFKVTRNIHVVNADDPNASYFGDLPANRKIFYGLSAGDMVARNVRTDGRTAGFEVMGTRFDVSFGGEFNVYNCLAALATAAMYGVDPPSAAPALAGVKGIPGRMEFIQKEPFAVVVDYAHTPDSLEQVYQTLGSTKSQAPSSKLICVLGAAGGGRDRWKRKQFGRLAEQYCDHIVLTDEDPYDENSDDIVRDIMSGFSTEKVKIKNVEVKMDRKEAIGRALMLAQGGDTVIITGKGSETSMALAGGKKIPWSDAQVARELLR